MGRKVKVRDVAALHKVNPIIAALHPGTLPLMPRAMGSASTTHRTWPFS